ncbi:hypothetical protein AB1Y20_005701 [Prymnesium parvum]|uniref:3'-5' exonuclease domain-containing protein n=1 Tax=Prymnesium parvum TaxID=97485 RepID=A0AB34J2D8_PRYPA
MHCTLLSAACAWHASARPLVRTAGASRTSDEAAAALGLPSAARVVKSLVFVSALGFPLLVLARGCDTVCLAALERHAGCRVRLASQREAARLMAAPVGTIGPFSAQHCATASVLMDERLLRLRRPVFTGAGRWGAHFRLMPRQLQRAVAATTGNYTCAPSASLPAASPSNPSASLPAASPSPPSASLPAASPSPPSASLPAASPSPPSASLPAASPSPPSPSLPAASPSPPSASLPAAPPSPPKPSPSPRSASLFPLSSSLASPPPPSLSPPRPPVNLKLAAALQLGSRCRAIRLPRAEVLRVRRMAKGLLFATVRPLEGLEEVWEGEVNEGEAEEESEGRTLCGAGLFEWQLIVGERLRRAVGEERSVALARQLRRGVLFAATALPQINPNEMAEVVMHGASPTQIDLVAEWVEILGENVGEGGGWGEESEEEADNGGGGEKQEEQAGGEEEGEVPPTDGSTSSLLAALPVPRVVDDEEGLLELGVALDRHALCLCWWRGVKEAESLPDGCVVAMDAEWLPRQLQEERREPSLGASLLQLAWDSAVFVVDVQALRRREGAAAAARHLLGRLLCAGRLRVVGFAVSEDLAKLEAALPGCAGGARCVTDLQPLAAAALGRPKRKPPGLGLAAKELLGVQLDKSEQVSDWTERPLRQAQLRYAAADAWILTRLCAALPPLAAAPVRRQRDATPPAARAAAAPTAPLPRGVSTRGLRLRVEELLRDHLGGSMGSREEALQLFAAASDGLAPTAAAEAVLKPAGGGGVTSWDGSATLFINTANSRPSAGRYRNLFWREPHGPHAGAVLMTWYPGRGQRIGDPSIRRLLCRDQTVLLLARLRPSRPFILCGRLRPVAIVFAAAAADSADVSSVDSEGSGAAAPGVDETWGVPVWACGGSQGEPSSPHIVWELVDAPRFLKGRFPVEELFQSSGISPVRPEQYVS